MKRGSSVAEPLNWLIIWHSVTVMVPSGTAKPTSSAKNSISTSPSRISPANGCVRPIAALGRIAEREQEAFVAAREVLQPHVAVGRKRQRLAREVADRALRIVRRQRLDQIIRGQQVGDARHRGVASAAARAGGAGGASWLSSSRRCV